jgi:hypothetical protein
VSDDTLLGFASGATKAIAWKTPDDVVPTCHLLSRDGERTLVGAADGRVLLYDRSGTQLWKHALRDRVESMSCTDDGRMFVVGTWGGEVAAFVTEGVFWKRESTGVVGAVAVTGGGERIVAGSWAGQLALYRRDGSPSTPTAFHDAVRALAIHPNGSAIYLVLVDHTLVVLEPDGRERFRRKLDAPPCHLSAVNDGIVIATEAGSLMWLNDEGVEQRETREVPNKIELVGASRDGSWLAWVDRHTWLTMWQPDRDRELEIRLDQRPDALAVTGQGAGTFVSVVLPTKIVTYNTYQRDCETPLPKRVRDVAFAGSGTSATATVFDGSSVIYIELLAVKDFLPEPSVRARVTAGELVRGNLGTITLDLNNEEGCRSAHRVEVSISSEFVAQQPRTEHIQTLRSGETVRITRAVEPTRAGKVPILITVSYEDELKNRFEKKHEEFVKVT